MYKKEEGEGEGEKEERREFKSEIPWVSESTEAPFPIRKAAIS